ncbi:hypothetical protein [Spirosoma validum]|uniref:Uncharacterized protein n=1 Tax=Spirosoma validum TaxID=2771355 RepID=A0A927B1G6_9BACT|nr:hypothetical protein [Spirosoma validum]MBD2753830.1 hypothetical protein [Spirosoma validum]
MSKRDRNQRRQEAREKKKLENKSQSAIKDVAHTGSTNNIFYKQHWFVKWVSKSAIRVYGILSIISTLAGLQIVQLFYPSIDFTMGQSTNKHHPFNTLIELKNNSFFSINDLILRLEIDTLRYGPAGKIADLGFELDTNLTILSGETESIPFKPMTAADSAYEIKYGNVAYDVSYKYLKIFTCNDRFNYEILFDNNKDVVWRRTQKHYFKKRTN